MSELMEMDTGAVPRLRHGRDKILSLSEIERVMEQTRARGERIVHCHGVFDLLHVGHLHHLEAARKFGDRLVVSLTADSHVNKGPGRPVFPMQLRAEMLAGMSLVDWVVIVSDPSAIPALQAVKPDVYVKGNDYANAEEDVTGKIRQERAVVEQNGGCVEFTDEVTFSSSTLLNRYFNLYDPAVQNFLQTMKDMDAEAVTAELMNTIANYKVLIVGDTIIDEYRYVVPMGKTPKENIIATLLQSHEVFAGGVIAAANHLAGFCASVDVITVLGTQEQPNNHTDVVRNALRPNVNLSVLHRGNAPTTTKVRYVDPSYIRKMFEVYVMDDTPLAEHEQAWVDQSIAERAAEYDIVIVTDFGHGMIADSTIAELTKRSRFLAINAQSNSANSGFNLITKYPKANYICIDAPEARLAVGDKHSDIRKICGKTLPSRIDCDRLIVTNGKLGCFIHDGNEVDVVHAPALSSSVVDSVGAGDAFFVVSSLFAAVGADMRLVGFVGNVAGAVKIGIVGHRLPVEKAIVQKYITTLLR